MSATGYVQYHVRTAIHSGVGSIIRIPALCGELGARRVLLLSDAGVTQAGIVDRIRGVFATNSRDNGVALVGTFDRIGLDATTDSVNEAIKVAREKDADALLAVGGGSVLDASKAVKFALDRNITDIVAWIQGGMVVDARAKPSRTAHIAVPTTAGTGAELIPGGMIYHEATGRKIPLAASYTEPDVAVLDPQLTLSLPPQLTAATGFDVLAHGLEALCSPTASALSDAHAFRAMQLTEELLPGLVADGSDLTARTHMLQASAMATNALLHAGGYQPVHVVSHAFGALYHIHHGDCLAAVVAPVIEVLADYYRPSARRMAQAVNLPVASTVSDQAVLEQVVAKIRTFVQSIGLAADFKARTLPRQDAARLVGIIATDPFGMMLPIPPDLAAQIVARVM